MLNHTLHSNHIDVYSSLQEQNQGIQHETGGWLIGTALAVAVNERKTEATNLFCCINAAANIARAHTRTHTQTHTYEQSCANFSFLQLNYWC